MAQTQNPSEVLEVIDPKPARRGAAVGAMGMLGMILLYLAAAHPPRDLAWLVFLLAVGAGCLYLSWRMWVVTGVRLELTRQELREEGGRVLCSIEEIASVDRGFFAFKPASGFLIRLKEESTRGGVYAPGLWWRRGKTIMVGGVTSRAQSKSVADLITVLLVERDHGR